MSKIDDFITRHKYRKDIYMEAMDAIKNVKNLPDNTSGTLSESMRVGFEVCEKMFYLERGVLVVLEKLKKEMENDG